MTISAIKKLYKEKLNTDERESDSIFYLLAMHYLGLSKTEILLESESHIADAPLKKLKQALRDLLKYTPVQYILGQTDFLDITINVTPHVLIPRPETQELVLLAKKYLIAPKQILDVGTGSGCIAISLAKYFSKASVIGTDISSQALTVAKNNAKRNKIKLNFYEQNILNTKSLDKSFDLIISNPPYICQSEKALMNSNVLNYEPHKALFVEDDDPLKFYKKIASLSFESLTSEGILMFEINERFGKDIYQMLQYIGFSKIEILNDIFGKNRFAISQRKS